MHIHQDQQFVLLCDGAGCRERIVLPEPATLSDVLTRAAASGWVTLILDILCPACAEKRRLG